MLSKSGYRRLRRCMPLRLSPGRRLRHHSLSCTLVLETLTKQASEAERKLSDETAMLKKQLGIVQQDVTAAKSALTKSMEECQRLKLQCSSRENTIEELRLKCSTL